MRVFFRYLSLFLVLASLGSIIYGFQLLEIRENEGQRLIGFGVSGIFLVAMPIFLISESRGKKWENYMLNEENIRKMRNNERKSPDL